MYWDMYWDMRWVHVLAINYLYQMTNIKQSTTSIANRKQRLRDAEAAEAKGDAEAKGARGPSPFLEPSPWIDAFAPKLLINQHHIPDIEDKAERDKDTNKVPVFTVLYSEI